jgi:FkbH-like protein
MLSEPSQVDPAAQAKAVILQKLAQKKWKFGPAWGEAKAHGLIFSDDGTISNYDHPNERFWTVREGQLLIFDFEKQLMWFAARYFVENDVFSVALKSPRDAMAEFLLTEAGEKSVAAVIEAPVAYSTADFLFPKDLSVTPVKFGRVLLIGSCMTALYDEHFKKIAPETIFDYFVFNYAGALPPLPASVETYDLQYVQLPLRSVLTDRIIWAASLNDPSFLDDVLSTGYQVIDAMLETALQYNISHGLLTFVSNFIVPQMTVSTSLRARFSPFDVSGVVRKLNDYIASSLANYKNVYLADVNGIAESIGKQYVLDDMINFYSHNGAFFREWVGYERPQRIEAIPPMDQFYLSKRLKFADAVYEQIVSTYRTCRQIDQVKAVVFDLDNTLWRGQIAEDYRSGEENWPHSDGWPLGIWEAIHHLRARGILVCICSKNDFETVQRDWANVVQPAFIKLEDFVSVKINWRPKAENILEICEELNIKPKSLLFVDDNPVERAAVKAALPDVRVIGANPYLTRRILLWSAETQVTSLTDESIKREDMVRSQIVREQERKSLSREEFFASLGCQIEFILISGSDQKEFTRVVELVNKTNQFNTTGRRWTAAEISSLIADGGDVTAFRVRDRFTEYGLVGVLFSKNQEVLQFVMSCRVLGMDVELAAVNYVVTLIRAKYGGGAVTASLVETKDNSPCRDVYMRAGFTAVPGESAFVLSPSALPVQPAHIH